MLGSGNLAKHLIRPLCNKTPPSVNGFIKTIYGKLFKMSLEFDRTSPFQRAHREQSVQLLKFVFSPIQPSLCCPILPFLSLYSLCWTDRDKNMPQGQHCSPESRHKRLRGLSFIWACDRSLPDLKEAADWEKISVIVMWYSAFRYSDIQVSGRHMWGNVTAVSNTYCAGFSQVGFSHSEDDTKSKMCYH